MWALSVRYQGANEGLRSDVELDRFLCRGGRIADFDGNQLHGGPGRDSRVGRSHGDLIVSQFARCPSQFAGGGIDLHAFGNVSFEGVRYRLARVVFLGVDTHIHFQPQGGRDGAFRVQKGDVIRGRKDISSCDIRAVVLKGSFDARRIVARPRLVPFGAIQCQRLAVHRDGQSIGGIVVCKGSQIESQDAMQIILGMEGMQQLGRVFDGARSRHLKPVGVKEIRFGGISEGPKLGIGQT